MLGALQHLSFSWKITVQPTEKSVTDRVACAQKKGRNRICIELHLVSLVNVLSLDDHGTCERVVLMVGSENGWDFGTLINETYLAMIELHSLFMIATRTIGSCCRYLHTVPPARVHT